MTPQPGDFVLLWSPQHKLFIRLQPELEPGRRFSTHLGDLELDELLRTPYGGRVRTHLGHEFVVLRATLVDFLLHGIERRTQIIYPKDSGYVVLKLGLEAGRRALEVGTGSGALTAVLAQAVAPTGRVYSYEREARFLETARRNLERLGLLNVVELKLKDAEGGVDEREVDAAFIDSREPWRCFPAVYEALRGGAPLGLLVPTTNQAAQALAELERAGFVDVEMLEILVRFYKPVPERLRPQDVMTGHTGYLIFARKALARP